MVKKEIPAEDSFDNNSILMTVVSLFYFPSLVMRFKRSYMRARRRDCSVNNNPCRLDWWER